MPIAVCISLSVAHAFDITCCQYTNCLLYTPVVHYNQLMLQMVAKKISETKPNCATNSIKPFNEFYYELKSYIFNLHSIWRIKIGTFMTVFICIIASLCVHNWLYWNWLKKFFESNKCFFFSISPSCDLFWFSSSRIILLHSIFNKSSRENRLLPKSKR